MEPVTVHYWGIMLDAAALTLCGMAIFYIVMKKRDLRNAAGQVSTEENVALIVRETFDQLIRQHPGKSFPQMLESANGEPKIRVRQSGHAEAAPKIVKRASRDTGMSPIRCVDLRTTGQEGFRDAKSLKIYEFTESGMSVQKISEKLAVPRCEVELIAKFHQCETGRQSWM